MDMKEEDKIDLFEIPIEVWLMMQEVAEGLDIGEGGVYDKRIGAINLWASPEDKPIDYNYPIVSKVKYPREFIAAIYTEPDLVVPFIEKPSDFKKIKTVKLYADFVASEGKRKRSEEKKPLISENEHDWVKQKISTLRKLAEMLIKVENSHKSELDKLTEEQIKNFNDEDTALLDIIKKLANATIDEILRLGKLSAKATYADPQSKLYQYNAPILAKYCHLIGGVWYLLEKNNYYASLIIERSMYEIRMYLRYFYLHPDEISDYENRKEYVKKFGSKAYNEKFSKPAILKKLLVNPKDFDKEYAYYQFLCNVDHPSTKFAILLSSSKRIEDDKNNKIHALLEFNPTFEKTKYMMGLLSLIHYNNSIIETEYEIMKENPELNPNKKLLEASVEVSKVLGYNTVWAQEGIREYYSRLKGRKLEDINKPFAQLGEYKQEIQDFLDNMLVGVL
jgi:hypothetical protein